MGVPESPPSPPRRVIILVIVEWYVCWKEGMNLINCAVVASCRCELSSLGKLSEEEADDWA